MIFLPFGLWRFWLNQCIPAAKEIARRYGNGGRQWIFDLSMIINIRDSFHAIITHKEKNLDTSLNAK